MTWAELRRIYLWHFAETLHCGPDVFDRLSVEDVQDGIRHIDARRGTSRGAL